MHATRLRPLTTLAFGLLMLAACGLFFAGGYVFGALDARSNQGPLARSGVLPPPPVTLNLSPEQERFRVVYEALAHLERSYYRRDGLEQGKLSQGAAKGLVEAVGDPHTVYLNPRTRAIADAELSGVFDGVGVQVDLRDGRLRVVAPIEGTPGHQAGLRPGDIITQVDGQDVSRLSLTDAIERIRGTRGTVVTLTVLREGEPSLLTFSITRAEIRVESVRSRMLEDDRIGYLRVSTFTDATASQAREQLRTLLAQAPRGMVLDLRGNPGGRLRAAVEVTSQFLRDGVVLYQQRTPDDTSDRRTYRTTGGAQAAGLPLVVLVDRGSASASEIVAAALRDNGRATLIGERTYGKGTVQELIALSDSSQLRVTVAQWLTPAGRPIQGDGLAPDEEIPVVPGRDAPLERAVEHLRNTRVTARG